jgi:nucleoside-diphosphate-sugar epimerase
MSENPCSAVALTGASGFIGHHLLAELVSSGQMDVKGLVRRSQMRHAGLRPVVGDLSDAAALAELCADRDCLFHCAGYAHAMDDGSPSHVQTHWRINFEGTRHLVDAAGRAGVKTFVHLSSVKAMAEPNGACVNEDWAGKPNSAYGEAKRAAEDAVLEAGVRYGMHVVNLRLAMVYGPGGDRGNLDRMARLIRRGWFPPLPETGNRRSMIYVSDVVSAIRRVAADSRASGRTYIVAEPEAYSGRQIYELLCLAVGRTPPDWAVPAAFLRLGGWTGDVLGELMHRSIPLNSMAVSRLLDSAWYSAERIAQELDWRAAVSLADGLRDTYAPMLR